MKTFLMIGTVLATTATGALAQGFTGAELNVETFAFSDELGTGFTSYGGALEFGITRDISVAADLAYYGFAVTDTDARSFGLHGIYQLSDGLSAGAFIAQDRLDGGSFTSYGVEGGTELSGLTVEGYFGMFDGEGANGTMFGVDGSYAISQNIAATGSFGAIDFLGNTTRLAIGGAYDFGGPTVFAEVGKTSGTIDDTFLTIGARVAIGAERGTTFNRRSIFEVLSGFVGG